MTRRAVDPIGPSRSGFPQIVDVHFVGQRHCMECIIGEIKGEVQVDPAKIGRGATGKRRLGDCSHIWNTCISESEVEHVDALKLDGGL